MIDTTERPMTPEQVAEWYQVSIGTVWAWLRSGRLRCIEAPTRSASNRGRKLRRITRAALEEFFEQGEAAKPAANRGLTAAGKALKERHGL